MIGFSIGRVYTSLSGWTEARTRDAHGTAQLALLGRWLQRKGYAFWSLGHCYSPEMEYKRNLGHRIFPRRDFRAFLALHRGDAFRVPAAAAGGGGTAAGSGGGAAAAAAFAPLRAGESAPVAELLSGEHVVPVLVPPAPSAPRPKTNKAAATKRAGGDGGGAGGGGSKKPKKVKPNAPCPCGSKKKFKKCCR